MNTPTNKENPMNNEISDLINKAVSNILINSSSENKLKKLIKTHYVKIHFVPRNYRIFWRNFAKYEHSIWEFFRRIYDSSNRI